ncbi:hypothetical protein PC116_g21689 [Phytophthora cactorum]|uniref:Uncharacterized protein n=1 Tax=Phytophthora cactorum TaxID=29920 RepID=A0A8T1JY88_9STRA|nr:hypothetical protein Pcac1_g15717 [Phytophthora cactorum]KAG2890922.1 hypothetical protein PC114_g17220 [Phytophthora cactorum]KAG2934316.1 hypothetical protein PC117_g12683 [Phytophthora cactorum]KAG2992695.1 hypothetical protein PC119_g18612 [Phytophthora cactorum]KAG3005218.1 hypothetical protein PC120_g18108 [Phytophthora cactorum]
MADVKHTETKSLEKSKGCILSVDRWTVSTFRIQYGTRYVHLDNCVGRAVAPRTARELKAAAGTSPSGTFEFDAVIDTAKLDQLSVTTFHRL